MGRWGEFPGTGIEPCDAPLRKAAPEVSELLDRLLNTAQELEKRCTRLTSSQLYELQRRIGSGINKLQRELDDMLLRHRVGQEE